ncbi:response regulator [Anaeromyxobacter diazotrophicus]|uniref:response regulator n=1 Tax=Anaeromyxobacter diazotrophicus TaxID=2590199 RepID=UPI001F17167F|nr:response regulator [Anaeromyxobacter diazotrophicus]
MAVAMTSGEVLLVEDDRAIRDTLRELLEDEGYRVQWAEHGLDALKQLRAGLRAGQRPRLILLDLMMPVMNGWEFREAQRRDPALSQIPVIVLSADDPLREKVVGMSVAGWFSKPFAISALLEAIHRCAGAAPPQRALAR